VYHGKNGRYRGRTIRTTYFERDYLPGMATDKLPVDRYSRPGYALKLAALLGRAAAPSLIVGRSFDETTSAFDDGDEVIVEGPDGLPGEILLGDHSGAFTAYKPALETFAESYARPVNLRDRWVADPPAFARAYLAALRDQLLHIQSDYRKRRRAFDTLFKHCNYDPAGSLAYRWECVLRRLDQADPARVVDAIRQHIHVLRTESQSEPACTPA
jgi:hypothetical protein